MKKNQVIRIICFCLCILAVMGALSRVFHYDKPNMRIGVQTYRDLEKGTIDAVLLGTSGIHCTYIPGQAFDRYGITSYDLTIDGMRVWHILPALKYALKYQSPELVLIDMRPFIFDGNENDNEVRSRYFHEIFPMLSYFRISGVNRTLKYLSRLSDTSRFDMTYYFNVLRYHDMWQDTLDLDVLKKGYSYAMGFRVTHDQFNVRPLADSAYTDKAEPLEDYAQECLDELLEYAGEKDVKLMFINTPHLVNEKTAMKMNTLHRILEEKDIPYLDFCTEEGEKTYPFDKETDFRDKSHTNYYGAVKFTDYLGEYLRSEMGLKDRSQDEKCIYFIEDYKKTLSRAVKVEESHG